MLKLILYILRIFGLKKVYKWELEESYVFIDDNLLGIELDLDYVKVMNNFIEIKKGYAWNGCTPRFSFFDLFEIGTPNGIKNFKTGKPKAYYASLVHDALYQYELVDRKFADKIFRKILKENDFMLANLYYIAVRIFGRRWKTNK